MLGAGGAARAVVWALVREGAEVDVWNRTGAARRAPLRGAGRASRSTAPDLRSYELIVNSTAVGLQRRGPLRRAAARAEPASQRGQTVVDLVYGEEPAELLAAAEAAGATVVDGIEILVRQGALSLEIWTGRRAPVDDHARRRAA